MKNWVERVKTWGTFAQSVTAIGVFLAGFVAVAVLPAWNVYSQTVSTYAKVGVLEAQLVDPLSGETMRTQVSRIESSLDDLAREVDGVAQKLTLLFEDAEYGIFICDSLGRNIEVNRTYARYLGCGKGDLLDFAWRGYVVPDELPPYDDQWRAAFAELRELRWTRITLQHAVTGRPIPVRVMISPMFEASDAALFMGRVEWLEEGQ